MSRHAEQGAALVFVVLLMLALLGLAQGVLLASLAELSASRAAARELSLRGSADYALHQTLHLPNVGWMDSLAPWEVKMLQLDSVGATTTEGSFRRLAAESWLVQGVATTPSGARASATRLAWSLDPLVRVTSLAGAVSVGPGAPISLAGSVDVTIPAASTPPMEPGACDPWLADLHDRYVGSPLAAVGALADSTTPSLGLLDFQRVMESATVTLGPVGTPGPAETAGVCLVDDAWVWGDPERPWRPCGGHMAMRARAGDLSMDGGIGQALLVVDGDLVLDAGARFYGLAIASGALRIGGGSSFSGMALAAGGLYVEAGSTLSGSACWAVLALARNRDALGQLLPVGSRRLGPT